MSIARTIPFDPNAAASANRPTTGDEEPFNWPALTSLLEAPLPVAAQDRILVKAQRELLLLKVDEIDWIEARRDYMRLHVGPRTHLSRETMNQLEARLGGSRFVRIHRSTIINLNRLEKLVPAAHGRYVAVLQDGRELKVGRGYRATLWTRLSR